MKYTHAHTHTRTPGGGGVAGEGAFKTDHMYITCSPFSPLMPFLPRFPRLPYKENKTSYHGNQLSYHGLFLRVLFCLLFTSRFSPFSFCFRKITLPNSIFDIDIYPQRQTNRYGAIDFQLQFSNEKTKQTALNMLPRCEKSFLIK